MSEPGSAVSAVSAVVIGVGNEFRRDDGAGPYVVTLLRSAVPESVGLVVSDGEPSALIEAWSGADLAVVVDAVRGDPAAAEPGRLHRLTVGDGAGTGDGDGDGDGTGLGDGTGDGEGTGDGDGEPALTVSSHGLGLGDAIGLARALDRMPGRLIVHAVEGVNWDYGVGLTPEVESAADEMAVAVLRDLGLAG
jgi:hydrogenase maturation protease